MKAIVQAARRQINCDGLALGKQENLQNLQKALYGTNTRPLA
jgi:hypothetical protein